MPFWSPAGASDDELVRRAKEGDVGAFADLVQRHQGRVLHTTTRFLGDEGLGEDVAQESFVAAYKALGSFRGESSFGTWIQRIAVNRCRNRRMADRRRHRDQHLPIGPSDDDGPDLDVPDSAPGPDMARLAGEVDAVIQRGLDALDDEHRAVLVLRDVQDLDYEEIADLLGIPRGTVKSRIHRARAALAVALGALLPSAERAS
jgi:RNA polymerase sigma-70 factor (ECF subfamily)